NCSSRVTREDCQHWVIPYPDLCGEVRRKTPWEGDLEGVQGCFPSVDPAFAAFAGGVDAHDGQVDALERGLVCWEVSAGVDGPADARVEAFDAVGRADHRPDFGVEGQERNELGPRVLPQFDDRRVALLPFAAELGERVQRRGLTGRGV